jgi:competence protein ComEA
MPDLSRSQLLVYAAIGVALLLVGARWIRSDEGGEAAAGLGSEIVDGRSGGASSGLAIERGAGGLVVHVAGGVRAPGVYRLPEGSRVADAVERAGGAAPRGLPDQINLAALLADGQQVVVPERSSGAGAVASGLGTAAEGPISLGTATVEELDTIEGIGPVTASDIVQFRDEHGGVGSVEDLDQISGIGPATMEALRESLQP